MGVAVLATFLPNEAASSMAVTAEAQPLVNARDTDATCFVPGKLADPKAGQTFHCRGPDSATVDEAEREGGLEWAQSGGPLQLFRGR